MTPIELFALIVVAISLIKIFVILVNPNKWIDFVETVWKNPAMVFVASLILAAVVLYYLLQVISIVEVFAVILFVILLSASTISVYSRDFVAFGRRMLRDKRIINKFWPAIIIWSLLSLWALSSIF